MTKWNEIPSAEVIENTKIALEKNGFEVYVVENGSEAKEKFNALVPANSEVMVMTSETLRTIGLEEEINNSGNFVSVKKKLGEMPESEGREKKKLGAASPVSTGSVHAITETGTVLIASNSGSQLPGYVFGSDTVVWVVGAQKITSNFETAMQRIQEYIVPLETERARKAYGLPDTFHTFVSKLLVYNREVVPGRVKIILVKESLGF